MLRASDHPIRVERGDEEYLLNEIIQGLFPCALGCCAAVIVLAVEISDVEVLGVASMMSKML